MPSRVVSPHFIIPPPPSGAYLGAQVNPSDGIDATPQQLESETEALESSLQNGRHLAMHLEYRNWKAMTTLASDYGIARDIAHYRVPVISWTCGDDAGTQKWNLIDIANGNADADLATIKAQLAQLPRAPDGKVIPVILRWFWEFNVNATAGPPNYNNTENTDIMPDGSNGNSGCFTDPKQSGTSLTKQFTDAWQHIYTQLLGNQPFPPATFDWNPNVQGLNNDEFLDPGPFYPGSGFVDWIGADGYDKEATTPPNNPVGFASVFQTWYTEFAVYGKPLIVGETGACDSYNYPHDQASYIQSFQRTMEPGSQQFFPGIKTLMYFDAPGSYTPPIEKKCAYSLSTQPKPPEISGSQAFVNLAGDSYFSAYVVQQ